jgi:hypothetical protein
MPKQKPSIQTPGLPKLFTPEEARGYLAVGRNKWLAIRRDIDSIKIEGRHLYSGDALQAYLQRKTKKGHPPEPRSKPPAKLTAR